MLESPVLACKYLTSILFHGDYTTNDSGMICIIPSWQNGEIIFSDCPLLPSLGTAWFFWRVQDFSRPAETHLPHASYDMLGANNPAAPAHQAEKQAQPTPHPAKEPEMRAKLLLLLTLSLLLFTTNALAETVVGLPLHKEELGSGVIRVWLGDHTSTTSIVAMATEKGIVVFDTSGDPSVDRELRSIIARELGRDDFAYLVNTHEHGDHTGGNVVYADCTIVGHELIAESMARQGQDLERRNAWRTTRIAELEQEIADLAPGAPEAARFKEDLIMVRLGLENSQAASEPVPPTLTFTDRMTLDLGDTTLEMYYIGGMHSASDIAIFVPEHGLLLTGDTMADVWLNDTPGCLAAFTARSGVPHNFPLLLENWNLLLAKKDSIKRLLPGHWNGELSFAGFEARVKYIEELWTGVNEAVASGSNMRAVLAGYSLDTRFPELAESPGCNLRNNSSTITEMWIVASGQESAAQALYDLVDQGADETAIRQVLDQRDAESPTYFFLEAQINGFGYRFLGQELPDKAVTMFRANVELFPESWNTYDSLGEALLATGDRDGAIDMYEKSLELNPENTNGQEMLSRIRSEASVN